LVTGVSGFVWLVYPVYLVYLVYSVYSVCSVYSVYLVCSVCSVYLVCSVWTRSGIVGSSGFDFRGIGPPGGACPLPRSASAPLRPRGIPRPKSLKIKAPPPSRSEKRRHRVIAYREPVAKAAQFNRSLQLTRLAHRNAGISSLPRCAIMNRAMPEPPGR